MEKETRNQKLKRLLKAYPKVKKFFFTSDDQAFIKKHDADNHAGTLEDKEVTPCSRAMFDQVEKLKSDKGAPGKGAGDGGKESDNEPKA